MTTAFLGSSIIQKWHTTTCIQNSINLGVSGLTSNDLTQTYVSKMRQFAHSKNIILYIGSNDVRKKHDSITTVKNISTFLDLLCEVCPKANVFYVSIIKSPIRTQKQLSEITLINNKIRQFVALKNTATLQYCNVNRQLRSSENYDTDKNHLSEIGYANLCKCILLK